MVVLEVGDKLGGTGNRTVISLLHSLSTGARDGALALKWWVSLLRVQLFAECWAHSPSQ